jgi:hypothetical protein
MVYNYNYCVSGHYLFSFYLNAHHFGDWILSLSSGENLLCWAQSVELVPISRHQDQHKIGHINQAQHKPSARVKTSIKNIKKNSTHEA